MGDGIWWLLVPGFVCCAVAMYCAYQILATWILLQSLPIHDIHRLLSDDFSWTWRQLLETLLTLGVDQEDMGRVIGRDGRIANAIRSLLRVMATRDGRHVELDIVNDAE